jgi:hypothetical protein
VIGPAATLVEGTDFEEPEMLLEVEVDVVVSTKARLLGQRPTN